MLCKSVQEITSYRTNKILHMTYVVVKYNTAYFVKVKMKLTHQINIQRLILFEWLDFFMDNI